MLANGLPDGSPGATVRSYREPVRPGGGEQDVLSPPSWEKEGEIISTGRTQALRLQRRRSNPPIPKSVIAQVPGAGTAVLPRTSTLMLRNTSATASEKPEALWPMPCRIT